MGIRASLRIGIGRQYKHKIKPHKNTQSLRLEIFWTPLYLSSSLVYII